MATSQSIREALADVSEASRWYADHGNIVNGMATGYEVIDETTWGLRPGHLSVVAGESSTGKTSFATGVTSFMVTQDHRRVLWTSLHEGAAQVANNLIASNAMIPEHKLRTGALSALEWDRHRDAVDALLATSGPDPEVQPPLVGLAPLAEPLRILAGRDIVMADIATAATEMQAVDLVVVDGLERLIANHVGDDHQDPATHTLTGLEALSRTMDAHVMTTLGLDLASRHDMRPRRSDLHEHRPVVAHADIVMGLYRDEVHYEDTADRGLLEVAFMRNGSGPLRIVKLACLPEYRKVANLARMTS